MFTRFIQNVRRWPRTFMVTTVLTLVNLACMRSATAFVINGVLSGIAYAWFMRDGYRVHLLLAMLDNFEGRESADQIPENWDEE